MPFNFQHTPPPLTQPVVSQPARLRPYDVQWNRPIFRAPSLPSATQIWSEIPFTAHFPLPSFSAKTK